MAKRQQTLVRHRFVRCEFHRLSKLYPHWRAEFVIEQVAKKSFLKTSTVEKILKEQDKAKKKRLGLK